MSLQVIVVPESRLSDFVQGGGLGNCFCLIWREWSWSNPPYNQISFFQICLAELYSSCQIDSTKSVWEERNFFSKNAIFGKCVFWPKDHNYLKLMSWGFRHRIEHPLLYCCAKRHFDSLFQNKKDLCFLFTKNDQKFFLKNVDFLVNYTSF